MLSFLTNTEPFGPAMRMLMGTLEGINGGMMATGGVGIPPLMKPAGATPPPLTNGLSWYLKPLPAGVARGTR